MKHIIKEKFNSFFINTGNHEHEDFKNLTRNTEEF